MAFLQVNRGKETFLKPKRVPRKRLTDFAPQFCTQDVSRYKRPYWNFLVSLNMLVYSLPGGVILNSFTGCRFNYLNDAKAYGLENPDWILYKHDDDNPLINDFG